MNLSWCSTRIKLKKGESGWLPGSDTMGLCCLRVGRRPRPGDHHFPRFSMIIIFHDFRWSSFREWSLIIVFFAFLILKSGGRRGGAVQPWSGLQQGGGDDHGHSDHDDQGQDHGNHDGVWCLVSTSGWEKMKAWVTAMNEMKIFARFSSSWTEWPNKWDTGRALTYRSLQS